MLRARYVGDSTVDATSIGEVRYSDLLSSRWGQIVGTGRDRLGSGWETK
jgi:hypothetical protein